MLAAAARALVTHFESALGLSPKARRLPGRMATWYEIPYLRWGGGAFGGGQQPSRPRPKDASIATMPPGCERGREVEA